MGESGAMKPSAVSSKKDALAPFVILMTAYLSLNSVLNLSNKYALVRVFFLPVFCLGAFEGAICTRVAAGKGGEINGGGQCRGKESEERALIGVAPRFFSFASLRFATPPFPPWPRRGCPDSARREQWLDNPSQSPSKRRGEKRGAVSRKRPSCVDSFF